MKKGDSFLWIGMLLAITLLPFGCGQKEKNHSDDKEQTKSEGKEDHSEEESPSGASFKAGKGVILTDQTREILGVQIVDVVDEALPLNIKLNVQIFSETHRIEDLNIDHTSCEIHGSGFLPQDKAVLVEPKQSVQLISAQKEVLDGFVVKVQKQLTQSEAEVIVGVTSKNTLKEGEFVNATISIPRNAPVIVIPSSALLRAAEGNFVYVVNGDAYHRTPVKIGSESEGKIEITDGLYAGDQVVSNAVETLWIIELRATKGGGHSH